MQQFIDMFAGAGAWSWIALLIFITVGVFLLWPKIMPERRSRATQAESFEQISNEIKTTQEAKNQIGAGDIKCMCFRKIKGVNVVDFTTIREGIGEAYQLDPSCPVSGFGYIVRENERGELEDYDPRAIEYKVEDSPEYAYFAIDWGIVGRIFYSPITWWKSVAVWFAGAILGIVFFLSLAILD